jgi:hypothetical protein
MHNHLNGYRVFIMDKSGKGLHFLSEGTEVVPCALIVLCLRVDSDAGEISDMRDEA